MPSIIRASPVGKSSARILVAEDEPLVRMFIVETLRDANYAVVEAGSGTEAAVLFDEPGHVALVVTDLHMPGMDGVELAIHVRRRRPDIGVLFISARSDLLETSRTPKPYRFLSKPFSMAALLAAVSEMLGAA